MKTIPCGGVIRSVAWCPNQALSLIAVAADKKVLLINPGVGDDGSISKTDQVLSIIPQNDKTGTGIQLFVWFVVISLNITK